MHASPLTHTDQGVSSTFPELRIAFRRFGVQLAYLFGSQAAGRTHAESDVDVAVLFAEDLAQSERETEQLALIGECMRVWSTDDVDLVVLNDAPPLLAYEVLRGGKMLYAASEDTRIEFQVRTVLRYEDTRPLRRILAQAMRERLEEGRFGKRVPLAAGTP